MYAEQQSNGQSNNYSDTAPSKADRPIVPRLTDAMHTVSRMLDQLRELEHRIMGARPELAGQVGSAQAPEPMLSMMPSGNATLTYTGPESEITIQGETFVRDVPREIHDQGVIAAALERDDFKRPRAPKLEPVAEPATPVEVVAIEPGAAEAPVVPEVPPAPAVPVAAPAPPTVVKAPKPKTQRKAKSKG